MSNLSYRLTYLISKRGELLTKLSIRIKLIIFLSTAVGIAYMFMLHFKNKAECERLEPRHVVCRQYRTSFDYAKSIFWKSSAEESLINYRLIGTKGGGRTLYLKTDWQPILYLYEPTEYQEKIPSAINRVENFIWGQGSSKMVLYLANSRDRRIQLYNLWAYPTFFLFIAELIARKQAELASKQNI